MSGRSLRVSLLAAAVLVLAAAFMGHAEAAQPKAKLPLGSANTIVTIRIASMNAAVKGMAELVTAFQPEAAPAINMMIMQQLAQFPGVDRDKPMAILILDPQKFNDPVVGIFPLLDPKAFSEGVEAAPVAVVGKLGIIGDHEGARAEVIAYLKAGRIKAVPVADMTSTAVVSAHSGSLIARYKKQIVAGFAEMKMEVAAAGADEEEPVLDAEKRAMITRCIDYARKFVDGIEKQGGLVEIGVSADGKLIKTTLSVTAVPGSPFASFLAKNSLPINRGLAELLPKNATASSIMAFDPVSFGEVGLGVVNIGCDILGMGVDETAAINKAFSAAMANASGLSAQAEVPVKGGMGGIALNGIKDKAAARAAMQAMMALADQGAIGKFLKKYGVSVSMEIKHREHRGIPIDKMAFNVDLDTLIAALPVEPEVGQVVKKEVEKAFLKAYGHKNKLTMEVVYGKRLAATAYGPDLTNTMNKQIDLMRAGGEGSIAGVPAYRDALAAHPADASLFVHLSLFGKIEEIGEAMAESMGPLMGGMNIFPKRSELPAEEEFIGAATTIKGNRVTTEICVPVGPLKAIVAVVKQKVAEQMRRQMEERRKNAEDADDGGDDQPFEDF